VTSAFRVLLLCFFLSGATALVYEVVWLRMLGLVFGHTVYALTTVLAAFMAGLGLGSWFFGRRAASFRDPIRVYGILEVAIGVSCGLTPA
jgi:spermidine synthase